MTAKGRFRGILKGHFLSWGWTTRFFEKETLTTLLRCPCVSKMAAANLIRVLSNFRESRGEMNRDSNWRENGGWNLKWTSMEPHQGAIKRWRYLWLPEITFTRSGGGNKATTPKTIQGVLKPVRGSFSSSLLRVISKWGLKSRDSSYGE